MSEVMIRITKITTKYDENYNPIYYKDSDGLEIWKEFDEGDNIIHYRDDRGLEYFYKWKDNKRIAISQQEFEQIKRNKVINSYLRNREVSRFELMDI